MPSSDTQRYDLPLLREHVAISAGRRFLEMGYYDPLAALWAAGAGASVVALRPTIDQLAELDLLAREAGLPNVEVRLAMGPEPAERGTFETALLMAPYFLGNVPVRDAMTAAAAALVSTGVLYFQAHRRRGGDTYVGYARALFEEVELLGLGRGQRRLYRATTPGVVEALPAEGADSGVALRSGALEVALRGRLLQLRLAAGVFSAHRVDPGTRLLLDTAVVPEGGRFLDLGCGAGTIGLALAAADPRSHVILVDASRPAVELTRENASANGLTNVEVRLSDGYAAVAGEQFDAILSNLPAHRGVRADSDVAERFIAGAPARLRQGGTTWLVANKALPYELPAARSFRQVRLAASDGRYKVLHCADPVQVRRR